jgi:hypothetical protein
MEKQTIDRLTVAGLATFALLSLIYLCWDRISQIRLTLPLDRPSPNIALPFGIPNFNLDWYNNMDPASRLVFIFVMMILVSTIIGGTWMYLMRRRSSARR